MSIRIAILGRNDHDRPARASIEPAIKDAAREMKHETTSEWFDDENCKFLTVSNFHGIFVAPGAPDEPHSHICEIIRQARATNLPCLGTCGGFQRIVQEYALNELGLTEIEHHEIHPNAKNPLFTSLPCSLVQKREQVLIKRDTQAFSIYRKTTAIEAFFCSFGLNPKFTEQFLDHGMLVSATDDQQSTRIIELPKNRFHIGTLFVPQVASKSQDPHPLVRAFLQACLERGSIRF